MIDKNCVRYLQDKVNINGFEYLMNDLEKKVGAFDYKLRFNDFDNQDIRIALAEVKSLKIGELIMYFVQKTNDSEIIAHLYGFKNEEEQTYWKIKLKKELKEFENEKRKNNG